MLKSLFIETFPKASNVISRATEEAFRMDLP